MARRHVLDTGRRGGWSRHHSCGSRRARGAGSGCSGARWTQGSRARRASQRRLRRDGRPTTDDGCCGSRHHGHEVRGRPPVQLLQRHSATVDTGKRPECRLRQRGLGRRVPPGCLVRAARADGRRTRLVHDRRVERRLRVHDVGQPGPLEGHSSGSEPVRLPVRRLCISAGDELRLGRPRLPPGNVELDQRRDDASRREPRGEPQPRRPPREHARVHDERCSDDVRRQLHAERVRRSVHGHGERPDAPSRELASSPARVARRCADRDDERHVPAHARGALRHASPGASRAGRRDVPESRVPAAVGDVLRQFRRERPGRQRCLDPHRAGDDEHRPVEARRRESEHHDLLRCRARGRRDGRRSADRRLTDDTLGGTGRSLCFDSDAGRRRHPGAHRSRLAFGHADELDLRPAQLACCDRQRRRRRLPRAPERAAGRRDHGALVSRHRPIALDDVRVRGAGLRRRRQCRSARDGERVHAVEWRHGLAQRAERPRGDGAEGAQGRSLVERVHGQRRRRRIRRLPQRDARRRARRARPTAIVRDAVRSRIRCAHATPPATSAGRRRP